LNQSKPLTTDFLPVVRQEGFDLTRVRGARVWFDFV
jgi:hypothetical protein